MLTNLCQLSLHFYPSRTIWVLDDDPRRNEPNNKPLKFKGLDGENVVTWIKSVKVFFQVLQNGRRPNPRHLDNGKPRVRLIISSHLSTSLNASTNTFLRGDEREQWYFECFNVTRIDRDLGLRCELLSIFISRNYNHNKLGEQLQLRSRVEEQELAQWITLFNSRWSGAILKLVLSYLTHSRSFRSRSRAELAIDWVTQFPNQFGPQNVGSGFDLVPT